MNQIKLNDFDLLVSKFKDKSGLITATVISKKGVARSETPQYRRDLLQMAVEQGYASSNGKHPNHNKYGIYFDVENRPKVVIEITFDPSVLNQANIIDLPPRRLKVGLNTEEIKKWNAHKEDWTDIYQLLCGFQVEGKINLKLLSAWYCPNTRERKSIEARRLILIYKILKLGWCELKEYFPSSGERGYNGLFQDVLWARSVVSFNRYSNINLIDRPRIQLDYMRELHNVEADPNDSDYQMLFQKFLGSNFDTYMQLCTEKLSVLGSGRVITYMLSSTQNGDIKKLLVEWKKLDEERKTSNRKSLSRQNDKSRTKKSHKKMFVHYVKTLHPDSIEKNAIDEYTKTLGSES